jgi:hypothetical protein
MIDARALSITFALRRNRTAALLAALACASFVSANDAPADGIYFEQTTRLVRKEGEPSAGVHSRVWHGPRRIRLEAGDTAGGPAMIVRFDEGRAFRLDPDARVAIEIDPQQLRARSHQDASVAGTLIGADDTLRVSELERKRTIAGYACRGFRLRSRAASMDVWVAPALPRGSVFAEFLEWSGAAQALPGLVAAVRELPGFPLETRTRVEVLGETQETLATVTRVRLGAQPPELFEVPQGFRVEPLAPQEGR